MEQEWNPRRTGSGFFGASVSRYPTTTDDSLFGIERSDTVKSLAGGLIKLRGRTDNLPQSVQTSCLSLCSSRSRSSSCSTSAYPCCLVLFPGILTLLRASRRWWFASTAIPLVAATIGPLSNVLSIAALASPWRLTLPDNGQLPAGIDDNGVGITDPKWYVESTMARSWLQVLMQLSLGRSYSTSFPWPLASWATYSCCSILPGECVTL